MSARSVIVHFFHVALHEVKPAFDIAQAKPGILAVEPGYVKAYPIVAVVNDQAAARLSNVKMDLCGLGMLQCILQ